MHSQTAQCTFMPETDCIMTILLTLLHAEAVDAELSKFRVIKV